MQLSTVTPWCAVEYIDLVTVQFSATQSSHSSVVNHNVSMHKHSCDVVLATGNVEFPFHCPSVGGSLACGKVKTKQIQDFIGTKNHTGGSIGHRVKSWVNWEAMPVQNAKHS